MVRKIRFVKEYCLALACMIYVFVFGFFVRRNRVLISSILRHFGLEPKARPEVRPLLPQIEVSEILKKDHPIRITEPLFRQGSTTLIELWVIDQLVKEFNPEALFEMGTLDGRTTLNLAANSNEQAKIYTLDLPREQIHATKFKLEKIERWTADKARSGSQFFGKPEAQKITQLYGDTATFDFSPYFNRMDFVFVDASHAYEYVVNDSLIALRLLKNGKGIILWDDYHGCPGVTQALNEFHKTRPEFKPLRWIRGTELAYRACF
ncbi:MAG: class I SAM-dependent methyltransferase [Candidatus Omnitrophica bacterium]|nr:class I SAM-dependent methyltransferase [Candidatus Omnitrophota bacterium]